MRSAYPTPIMPMDAHDLAFEAFRDRVKAERNLSRTATPREATQAGVCPTAPRPAFWKLIKGSKA